MSQFRAYFSWNSSHFVGASVVLGALAYLGAAPIACSANGERLFNNTGGGGSSNGGQGGMGTGGKAQGGDGGDPLLTVGSTGSGSSCAIHCSADLHEVLDCNNAVVKTCPAGQGCEPGGTCVDACAAAEANGSTIGCEFYAVQPSAITQSRGACYAAALANTWSTPIGLQVEYDGQMLDATQFARIPTGSGASLTYEPLPNGQLDPGKIAVLFLAQAPGAMPACPSPVAIAKDTSVPGSGLSKAFRIQATAPVVAYDIFPYGGAPSFVASATLLIPTPAWGTNYIAADAYEQEPLFSGINASPFMQIVGTEDNTQVTILPRVDIVGGPGVSIATKGQPATYLVNRGQVLQFLQNEELAGSPISSDKPIGVWGGSGCMNIPTSKYACDCGHQQILPVKALGSEYVAARYRDRMAGNNEAVLWTITGAVDGTNLTYDPAAPVGAPTTLLGGQIARFSSKDSFTVKSQDADHPFALAGHMSGWTNLPGSNQGDPEYVITIPPAQYLNHYLFLTDSTYKTSHLVFVRQKTKDGMFKPVSLDCLGEVTNWQPIGASGQYEYAGVDLVKDGAPQGACDNGVHTADSDAPFGLTVWGWDFAVSYAYPAGMSTQPINTVVIPPVPK